MKRISLIKQLSFVCSLSAAMVSSQSWAATAAYWRHEEGSAGSHVAGALDSVLDSSGNGNHMRTFNAATTAATYTTDVSPLALRSGLQNTLSLDFGPGGDDPGLNDDNYTEGKTIQTQLFTAMTVELAFKMNAVTGFQTLFGKDGKPLGDAPGEDDSPVAPLQIKVRGDNFPNAIPNQLFVEWIDGDGQLFSDIHFLASGETIVADQWYHIAFTLTATDAELWIAKETGDYVLVDSKRDQDYAGSLGPGEVTVFEPLGYAIGRGFFGNGVADWSDALIDEVRVSDTALTPDQFLFEPAEGVPGDFDGDGDVDGRDFLAWQRGDSPDPLSSEDLSDWQANYGEGNLTAQISAVPEPSTMALVVITLAGIGAIRRR